MPGSPDEARRVFTCGGAVLGPGSPLRDWIAGMGEALGAAGVHTPLIDAHLLIVHALGLSHGQLNSEPSRPVTAEEVDRITAVAERRLAREPMSRILGVRKFFGRKFELTPGVLDPRRDTETLIAAVLDIVQVERWRDQSIEVLDLGVGSGAILHTLLAELPRATGLGTDLSEECIEAARVNAVSLSVAGRCRFQIANWLDGVSGAFHFVTANPPYMTDETIAELAPEAGVYDPRLALDGGGDGLSAYRSIIPALPNVLRPGGWVVFQVGEGQAAPVGHLLRSYGLEMEDREICVRNDHLGVERIVAARRPGVRSGA